MKDIKAYIIRESQAESLYKSKKGDVLWICDLEEASNNAKPSCAKVTITNIDKEPMPGRSQEDFEKYHIVRIDFSNNKYGISCYRFYQVPTLRSGWMARQIGIEWLNNGDNDSKLYYIGTSKEVIEEYIAAGAKRDLEPVLNKISKLEQKLQDLYAQKAKLEEAMETQLQENKQQ